MADPSFTEIHPATSQDIPAIKAIVNAAYSKYISRLGMQPAPMLADYDHYRQQQQLFVLRCEDTIVGSIVLVAEADALEVDNVVVDPACQGRGYGRILMAYAEDRARAEGLGVVRLYTNVKMAENLAMYVKLGYVEYDRRTVDGYDRVFFQKVIAI